MSEFSSDVLEAMGKAGIDPASLDNGDIKVEDLPQEEAVESAPEETGEEVAAEGEEVANEENKEDNAVKAEGEENKEAPIEEPKLTAKEFREIYERETKLEAERKAFQDEMVKREQEFVSQYQDKLQEYDRFDSFLANLAESRPELFEEVKAEFKEHSRHFTNPVVDKVTQEIASLKKELGQFKAEASDRVTLAKLDAEWSSFMGSTGKDAEKAGIKVDRKALEDSWAKSGGSLEEAFYAKYGKALVSAAVSKTKVESAEKKVQAVPKVSTVGSVKRSNVPTTKDWKSMSWDEAAAHAVKSVLGKSA